MPACLVVSLGMYEENYFEPGHKRMVKPVVGNALLIEPHYLVGLYMEDQLKAMVKDVQDLCKEVVAARFANAAAESENKSMYIDPMLFHIPLAIGDRSETIQDTSCDLQGKRFTEEGDKVRLFMQWGKGLPAQHLDMDLSCHITLPSTTEVCSFFNLQAIGAKHSGDIRSIPNKKGTAEYIELDLNELNRVGAEYVAFTCNAYSNGTISPNLVVGWMNSAYPMKISERTGVAYDPSCVQHQVRISQSLQKGLVFGVLKVKEREIVWLEIPFGGQTILSLDTQTIEKYLDKRIRVKRGEKIWTASKRKNEGAGCAKGEYLIFLAGNAEFEDKEGISELVSTCMRSNVGVLGARSYYKNGTLEHAGCVIGMNGSAGSLFEHTLRGEKG